jgi:hypothetical protein
MFRHSVPENLSDNSRTLLFLPVIADYKQYACQNERDAKHKDYLQADQN